MLRHFWSQMHVCFFKHQLGELPPYPQLPVSLGPHWKKHWSPRCLWNWLVCTLCFVSVPTPPSLSAWGLAWATLAHLTLQGFEAFSGTCVVAPDFCCIGGHGALREIIICPQISPGSGPGGKQRLPRYVNEAAWVTGTLYIITHILRGCLRALERGALLAEVLELLLRTGAASKA